MSFAGGRRRSLPSWPGEVPAIHVDLRGIAVARSGQRDAAKLSGDSLSCHIHVDGRVKPGHDGGWSEHS